MNIRRGLPLFMLLLLGSALTGCVSRFATPDNAQVSPLQIRAMQTRTFEGYEAKTTLKTVLNVFLDEGFLVDYGNTELGLLHASRIIGANEIENTSIPWRSYLGPALNGSVSSAVEATANVSESGDRIRIRISFQVKIADQWGNVLTASSVKEPGPYQDFFAKIERGLFIQKQGL